MHRAGLLAAVSALLLGAALPDGRPAAASPGYLSYLLVADDDGPSGTAEASAAAADAGGVLAHRYTEIGVILAYASDPDFARRAAAEPGIAKVGATRTVRTRSIPVIAASADAGRSGTSGASAGEAGEAGATGAVGPVGGIPRPLDGAGTPGRVPMPVPVPAGLGGISDERATRVPPAHVLPADDGGYPDPHERGAWFRTAVGADRTSVEALAAGTPAASRPVVAVLDSGVDDTHPDLAAEVDPARSASCETGAPDNSFGAWRPLSNYDDSGHGTHVAGIVAAARDGDGVAGIDPGARIAAVRLLGTAGQYYAENIVCGFVWAAEHGARVVNSSYFADPWKYNCPGQPDQAAIIAAVGRAVAYAQRSGAVVVASAGNDGVDLRAPHEDDRSPNDHPAGTIPPVRQVGPECIRLPGQLPGVLKATALDRDGRAASYSNDDGGPGTVAAPGGDPDAPPSQQIVSSWPGGGYRALSGTSMSAAVVSGVSAVIAEQHPGLTGSRLRAAVLADTVTDPAGPAFGPLVHIP
ncbi:hypothetical protein BIV57_15365 [Mangrovactinospora gilvigrisea]|uniref:Peptidase S8/S53 domain-containing protein n=1 Tax=Mangrovactinospora gilvigrisea TaxID=1428644 RepID=A0A1J7C4X3_9ACTN|nr:hypothetical protein BIV57_15365 [Mangrovactinospora gilvigrisea]